jgi:hydrogenase maturation protease
VETNKILVLGIGNYLMGDEGIGVHVIKSLDAKSFPENVTLLDGGTGGFHLLSYFQEYPKIIMIDATMDGSPAGTIKIITPKFASDFPSALSAHDIGLKDMIESMHLLGNMPKIYLITVSITEIKSMVMELSEDVKKSIQMVSEKVGELVEREFR